MPIIIIIEMEEQYNTFSNDITIILHEYIHSVYDIIGMPTTVPTAISKIFPMQTIYLNR